MREGTRREGDCDLVPARVDEVHAAVARLHEQLHVVQVAARRQHEPRDLDEAARRARSGRARGPRAARVHVDVKVGALARPVEPPPLDQLLRERRQPHRPRRRKPSALEHRRLEGKRRAGPRDHGGDGRAGGALAQRRQRAWLVECFLIFLGHRRDLDQQPGHARVAQHVLLPRRRPQPPLAEDVGRLQRPRAADLRPAEVERGARQGGDAVACRRHHAGVGRAARCRHVGKDDLWRPASGAPAVADIL